MRYSTGGWVATSLAKPGSRVVGLTEATKNITHVETEGVARGVMLGVSHGIFNIKRKACMRSCGCWRSAERGVLSSMSSGWSGTAPVPTQFCCPLSQLSIVFLLWNDPSAKIPKERASLATQCSSPPPRALLPCSLTCSSSIQWSIMR